MTPPFVFQNSTPDQKAKVFVWGVWLAMLIADLLFLVSHVRNIPEAEDWYMVPPLTGREPNLGAWLWAQNNEHRFPLPRLILLTALNLTKGDFRSGAVLNVLTLALVAAVGILVARHLRGERTSYADAFFPVTLLNVGLWPNLFWGWLFTFVLPTALVFTLLFVFVIQPTLTTPIAAAIAGVSLISLPLCGAIGLLFVPFTASWFIYRGLVNWYASSAIENRRRMSIPIGSAIITLCLTGIYFIGYQRPAWVPPNPGVMATLQTAGKFLAYSFGAVAANSWNLFVLIAFGVLVPTLGTLILATIRLHSFEKQRALAILLFCGSLLMFALAIGYGRAGSPEGFPIRYVILATPVLCTVFFVWELYGSKKWLKVFQVGLFVGMLLLVPFNSRAGFFYFGNWYDGAMDAVERDIDAGMSISELSKRHRNDLVHWFTEPELEKYMKMLYEYRVGPFARIKPCVRNIWGDCRP